MIWNVEDEAELTALCAAARIALPAALAEIARLRAALACAQADARGWQALAYESRDTAIATERAIPRGKSLRECNWAYAAMDRQRARLLGYALRYRRLWLTGEGKGA